MADGSLVSLPLSRALKERTRDLHDVVERATFITRFLKGLLDEESYARLLLSLFDIYTALEEGLVRTRDESLASFARPALYRATALDRDLAFFGVRHGERSRSDVAAQIAGRLRKLADEEPVRLVGWWYVRYLGDLSGGRVLGKIAARMLGLSGEDGLRFYAFPDVIDVAAEKAHMRALLDQIPCVGHAAVLDEACIAFRLSLDLFNELEGQWWQVLPRLLRKSEPVKAAR